MSVHACVRYIAWLILPLLADRGNSVIGLCLLAHLCQIVEQSQMLTKLFCLPMYVSIYYIGLILVLCTDLIFYPIGCI